MLQTLPLPEESLAEDVEKELSLPAESTLTQEESKSSEAEIVAPIWWTAFVCNLRAGHNATDSYKRARPNLLISHDTYKVKAYQLLRHVSFRTWLARLDQGINEVEDWKRKTIVRAERLRSKLDKTIESKDVHAPKDLKSIADTENVADLIARRSFGLDDDKANVKVEVNMQSVIASLQDGAKEVSEAALNDFTGEA